MQYETIGDRLNSANRLITSDDITSILHKYGVYVSVKDLRHYQTGLTHKSYIGNMEGVKCEKGVVPLQPLSNERQELLGDCIVSNVVGPYLYTRYSDQSEGFLTRAKTKLVRHKTLAKLGKALGLGKLVLISRSVEDDKGRSNKRILEDLFECFIGAIYLDNGSDPVTPEWFKQWEEYRELSVELEQFGEVTVENYRDYVELSKRFQQVSNSVISSRSNGYHVCQRFILSVMEQELNMVKIITTNDNYKDQIQTYYHHHFEGIQPSMIWKVLEVIGPTSDRWHVVGVYDDRGELIGTGKARKKIEAEQLASKNALKFLGEEVCSDSEDESESEAEESETKEE